MNENMKIGLLGGIINFSLVLVNILVVTVMWQMAGVPYNGAFSVVVFCALLGTLIAAYYQLAVVVAPSIVLNSFLCYDLVISQGFAWQEVMSLPLLAGLAIICNGSGSPSEVFGSIYSRNPWCVFNISGTYYESYGDSFPGSDNRYGKLL